MRILQIGPFPPPHGGVQTHLKAIHDRLPSRGHVGIVIAITRGSVIDGVPRAYKPRTAFSLFWLLLTLKYDLVHLHIGGELTTRLAILMLVCGLLPYRKSVVTFHSGGYAANQGSTATRNSLRGFAFRSVDHVIAVNRQMVDMFLRFGVEKRRLSLIPPFVARRPSPEITLNGRVGAFIEQRDPVLLTVGLLEKEYALDVQIDALEKVLETHPNAGLLVAGSGSLSREVNDLVEAKPFKERILLAGDLDHDLTLRAMELADVLLRPTYYDGDAVSIREGLYLGTPVIATDNGMRPPGVNLIPLPPDPARLAEKVIEVLSNHDSGAALPAPDGSENVEAVLNVYDRLLTIADGEPV